MIVDSSVILAQKKRLFCHLPIISRSGSQASASLRGSTSPKQGFEWRCLGTPSGASPLRSTVLQASDWLRSQQVTQASPIRSLSQDSHWLCGNDRQASSCSEVVGEIESQPGLWGVKQVGGGELLTLLLTLHASLNFPGKEQSVPFRFGPFGGFPTLAKCKGKLTITELTSDVCGGIRLTQDCPSQRKTVTPYHPRPTLPDFLLFQFCSVSTKQG